jgi:hypothetical protein
MDIMRFRKGLRVAAVLGTAGLPPLAASGAAAAAHSPVRVFKGTKSVLTKAQVERLAARATHHSIIIVKDQLRGLPAGGATANARIQAANTAAGGRAGGTAAGPRRARAQLPHHQRDLGDHLHGRDQEAEG